MRQTTGTRRSGSARIVKDIKRATRKNKRRAALTEWFPNLHFLGLRDYGILRRVRIRLTAPSQKKYFLRNRHNFDSKVH